MLDQRHLGDEIRRLDQIRASLRDPHCDGPQEVYAIAMDVARMQDRETLQKRMLLFGVAMVAIMIFRPEGLWPSQVRKRELNRGKEQPA